MTVLKIRLTRFKTWVATTLAGTSYTRLKSSPFSHIRRSNTKVKRRRPYNILSGAQLLADPWEAREFFPGFAMGLISVGAIPCRCHVCWGDKGTLCSVFALLCAEMCDDNYCEIRFCLLDRSFRNSGGEG